MDVLVPTLALVLLGASSACPKCTFVHSVSMKVTWNVHQLALDQLLFLPWVHCKYHFL